MSTDQKKSDENKKVYTEPTLVNRGRLADVTEGVAGGITDGG